MRPLLRFLLLAVCVLGIVGCKTTGDNPTTASAKPSQRDDPFLVRGDYPEELGLLIQKVFSSHRFLRPWIVVKSPDSSIWFVAERDETPLRFDRLYVWITPKREVSASITAFQFHASDWAMLGPLFRKKFNPKDEAETISSEISKQLKESQIEFR